MQFLPEGLRGGAAHDDPSNKPYRYAEGGPSVYLLASRYMDIVLHSLYSLIRADTFCKNGSIQYNPINQTFY